MRTLGALLVLFALPALADDAVQAYLRAANKLYQQLEYEKALEQLQRAKKSAAGLEDDVKIALWEGIVYSDLGKGEDAKAAFNTALALKADAVLPVKVSPKVTAVFEKLRTEAQKELARSAPLKTLPEPVVAEAPSPAPPPAPVVAAAPVEPPPPTPPPAAPPAEVSTSGGGARRASIVPFVLGGAGAVTGVIGGVLAGSAASRLKSERFSSLQAAASVRDSGALYQLVGFTGLGVAAAGLLTGTLMYLFGGPTQVALAPSPGGATFSFILELP